MALDSAFLYDVFLSHNHADKPGAAALAWGWVAWSKTPQPRFFFSSPASSFLRVIRF